MLNVFIPISDNTFINGDHVTGIRIEQVFLEDGERWFIHLYGLFDFPPELLERDGSLIAGPFNSKQEALDFLFESKNEVVIELEKKE